MSILVYIKPVLKPDSLNLHPVKKKLTVSSKEKFISHDDLAALELALQLKAECGDEVTAITCGGSDADVLLRQAVGMGADKGILVKSGSSDPITVAKAVAEVVKELKPDYVFSGLTCTNKDLECTGNLAAAMLGYNQISGVSSVKFENGGVVCNRVNNCKKQTIKVPSKSVIYVTGDVSVRYMHVSRVFGVYGEGLVEEETPEVEETDCYTITGFEPRLTGRQKKVADGEEDELVQQIVDYLKAIGVVAKGGNV